jgi:HEAT repeat protein
MKHTMIALTLALALGSTQAVAQGTGGQQPNRLVFQGRPLSAWIKDLKAAAPQTRNAAAYSIGSFGPAAKSAVPALIDALNDPVAAVRYPVCIALREIGPDAAAAVPALQKALDDPNDDVAAIARKALKAITGKDPDQPEGHD